MLHAHEVIAKGDWHGEAHETVVLDFEDRHRRRTSLEAVSGLTFLLDLAEPVALRSGDALKLSDGRVVEVIGASESLLEIKAETIEHLTRLAWHLGNRHLPVQVVKDRLRIRADHVIAEMVRGLGGQVRAVEAAFDPEGGAYAARKTADHHHSHDHAHHDHAHHAHKHDHHEHGEGCGCGHDHHDHGHHHGHANKHG